MNLEALARECCDITEDRRGRLAFEFDDAGLTRFAALILGQVVPKVKNLMKDETVVAGLVNFETIEAAIRALMAAPLSSDNNLPPT